MKTTEGNKLIAEFMEWEIFPLSEEVKTPHVWRGSIFGSLAESDMFYFSELEFHTSWDWLMPVVEKIRNILSYDRDIFGTEFTLNGGKVTIKSGSYTEKAHCKLYFNKKYDSVLYNVGHDSLKITYIAVVEFITWYNENK